MKVLERIVVIVLTTLFGFAADFQIAIVSKGHYKFKPGDVWKFEIPVTNDVEKAKFRGLYVPSKEVK